MKVLGSRVGDIPLASSEAESCAVLRANALERQDKVDAAQDQLVAAMSDDATGPAGVLQFLSLQQELDLCPQAFANAKLLVDDLVLERGEDLVRRKTNIGGVIFAGVGFGGGAIVFTGMFIESVMAGQVGRAIGIGLSSLLFWGLVAIIVWLGVFDQVRTLRRLRTLYESGSDAQVTVIDVRGAHLKVLVPLADHDS